MESRVKREDGRMIVSIKPCGALSKIETAILTLQDGRLKEINVALKLDDLYWIRRALAIDLFETELARENIVDGIKYKKALKESE